MPSPIAHALAGIVTAWSADPLRPSSSRNRWPSTLVAASAVLATLPDLDLLYPPIHRMMTHSIVAVAIVVLASAAITRRAAGRTMWSVSFACAAAYASHLLLDWLGGDLKSPAGIQLLWPFSDQWFISNWALFRPTELARPFTLPTITWNAKAVFREMFILLPIAFSSWWIRHRALQRPLARADGE